MQRTGGLGEVGFGRAAARVEAGRGVRAGAGRGCVGGRLRARIGCLAISVRGGVRVGQVWRGTGGVVRRGSAQRVRGCARVLSLWLSS